jgi:ferredoxin
MKAVVDKDLCAACGICAEICPEVFEIGEDGIAIAKAPEVPAGVEDSCKDAAGQCPAEAIKVED